MANRKIAFFTLVKKNGLEESPLSEINDIITFINNLKEKERIHTVKGNKSYSLTSVTYNTENTIITGIFKSARIQYRPPYWDVKTNIERESPKKETEGEKEKTHFAIKIKEEEVFFVLESNGNGISIVNAMSYFEYFKEQYILSNNKILSDANKIRNFKIAHKKIGKDNFSEELEKLNRARVITLTLDKSLIGSPGLNFSGRTTTLQKYITLTVKADRGESAKETAIDIFNIFNRQKTKNSISKIRIEGKDENDVNTILDTSFMEKIELVEVQLNSATGEVQTTGMLDILKTYLTNL